MVSQVQDETNDWHSMLQTAMIVKEPSEVKPHLVWQWQVCKVLLDVLVLHQRRLRIVIRGRLGLCRGTAAASSTAPARQQSSYLTEDGRLIADDLP